MSRRIFLTLVFSLLTVQGGLAQTADYYLQRIAIHTRLMESKLEATKLESQFQGDLQRLAADLEKWKNTFLEEDDIKEVRELLDDHGHMLRASALTASLDTEQTTSLELLLLEIENGSQSLTPDRFSQRPIRIPYDLPSSERDNPIYLNQWGGWGGNFGGWGGLCAPSVDPLGPYFGRPLHPNFGPLW